MYDNRKSFKAITDMMNELNAKKLNDYGNTFGNMCKSFGKIYPLIEIQKKINRLNNLISSGNEPQNESIIDSFVDIANYAVLSIIEFQSQDADNQCVCEHDTDCKKNTLAILAEPGERCVLYDGRKADGSVIGSVNRVIGTGTFQCSKFDESNNMYRIMWTDCKMRNGKPFVNSNGNSDVIRWFTIDDLALINHMDPNDIKRVSIKSDYLV